MNIEMWKQAITEVNDSFDELIGQKNMVLGVMEKYLKEKFHHYTGVNPVINLPMMHDEEFKILYGHEIVVTLPFESDNSIMLPSELFTEIGWKFRMDRGFNDDMGSTTEITFYPFDDVGD